MVSNYSTVAVVKSQVSCNLGEEAVILKPKSDQTSHLSIGVDRNHSGKLKAHVWAESQKNSPRWYSSYFPLSLLAITIICCLLFDDFSLTNNK